MGPHDPAKPDTYALVITRRDASEVLLLPSGSNWLLPRTEIPSRQRPPEPLVEAVAQHFQLESYCLFTGPCDRNDRNANWAVMEVLKQNGSPPDGTRWVPVSAANNLAEKNDDQSYQEALEELGSYRREEKRGPFGRPGWLRELFCWAQEQIDRFGMRLTGCFRQLNASPTFSLIRLETHDGALWFKATGAPNEHELTITLTVARLFPSFVPRIFGVHSTWNGWLSLEAPGPSLDNISQSAAWERAASDLAELQIASIGKCSELLEGKCKDFRVQEIAKCIVPFCERMADFMAAQQNRSPAPLAKSELTSLRRALEYVSEQLLSYRLPDTLGHIDCNPGNIVLCPDRCVFLDWAEGCVSHPFVTFEYLRQHAERTNLSESASTARLTTAYLRRWEAFYSRESLQRALASVPLMAVFNYAVANDKWRSPETLYDPTTARYLRSLTRRMYREAVQVMERSEPCLESR